MKTYIKNPLALSLIMLFATVCAIAPAKAVKMELNVINRAGTVVSVTLYQCNNNDVCTMEKNTFFGKANKGPDFNKLNPEYGSVFQFEKKEGYTYELQVNNKTQKVKCPKIAIEANGMIDYKITEKRKLSQGFRKVLYCKVL